MKDVLGSLFFRSLTGDILRTAQVDQCIQINTKILERQRNSLVTVYLKWQQHNEQNKYDRTLVIQVDLNYKEQAQSTQLQVCLGNRT